MRYRDLQVECIPFGYNANIWVMLDGLMGLFMNVFSALSPVCHLALGTCKDTDG